MAESPIIKQITEFFNKVRTLHQEYNDLAIKNGAKKSDLNLGEINAQEEKIKAVVKNEYNLANSYQDLKKVCQDLRKRMNEMEVAHAKEKAELEDKIVDLENTIYGQNEEINGLKTTVREMGAQINMYMIDKDCLVIGAMIKDFEESIIDEVFGDYDGDDMPASLIQLIAAERDGKLLPKFADKWNRIKEQKGLTNTLINAMSEAKNTRNSKAHNFTQKDEIEAYENLQFGKKTRETRNLIKALNIIRKK